MEIEVSLVNGFQYHQSASYNFRCQLVCRTFLHSPLIHLSRGSAIERNGREKYLNQAVRINGK